MTDKSAPVMETATLDIQGGSFLSLLQRAAPVTSSQPVQPLPGSTLLQGRFGIGRRVGEGAMGCVFEAFDEQRRSAVAIKTLSWLDPDSVYRIKSEFRSLADVRHPNLCQLHELFSDDGWFFSMELVNGERFDRWVRPNDVLDESRLRDALAQLLSGVGAIHDAGKLHRDLKPSNVLVDEDGRVVVLDFGLAVAWNPDDPGRTGMQEGLSGTPAYMAPEQVSGAAATAASDLYSIGTMLFVALTGRLPFQGGVDEILAAKLRDPAIGVGAVFADAPPDLATLCDRLLERDPAKRPDAGQLRAALGPARRASARPAEPTGTAKAREQFFGRETEMAELQAAYDEMVAGQAVALFVVGESGMGKSTLVHRFLDQVRAQGRAVVLEGRCYERENVPFKALDAVVDDLSGHLHQLKREDAGDLMPREIFALARLFPVLERVGAVAQVPKKEIPDPQELRERAFAALGELLGRIRDRRPLVVFVDDLQWTDLDSTVFMDYLLSQSVPTPFLLVASHRSEGASVNALLQQTLRAAQKNPRVNARILTVGKLPAAAAQLLAQELLGRSTAAEAASIAAEAGGSPFFVGELARQTRQAGAGSIHLTLRQTVLRRVGLLAPQARAVLDVLAVAGRPLAAQSAINAAGATYEAVDALLFEHLARTARLARDSRMIECYHDKIRESVLDALPSDALAHVHRRLADELSARNDADPEHLGLHFQGAGEHQRAAGYYELAGDTSDAALAFDNAARQYQQALALHDGEPTRARQLRVKLGAMLASAGSGREAAEVYRAACVGAPPDEALEYMRTAAHLLTTSGYLDEGRILMGEVLAAIGLSMPRSQGSAIVAALISRARLGLRGLRLAKSVALSPGEEARLGAMWTVVQGSVGNDPFVMVDMAARYARLALDRGSRAHAARALSMEAYLGSFDGPATHAKTEPILSTAERLAGEVCDPELTGWVREIRGCVLVHEGRFAEARPVLTAVIEWLGSQCKAVPFETACAHGYNLNAANHLGEYAYTSNSAPVLVDNALRRGDLYLACGVVSFAAPALFAHRGLADGGARFAQAKLRYQPQSTYQWVDYLMLVAELNLALYEGQPARGVALAAQQWPALGRSQLMRMQLAGAMMSYYRAGCALAAARQRSINAAQGLALAQSTVGILNKTRVAHAPAWGAVLEAGLACEQREPGAAAERLQAAITLFDAIGMQMFAAAARRRLGQLSGGDAGRAIQAASEAAMRAQGVIDLEATTEMLVPGCQPASG